MSKLIAFILFAFFLTPNLFAQEVQDDPARPSLMGVGKVFVVRVTPKSRRVQIGLLSDMNTDIETGRLKVSAKDVPEAGKSENLPLETRQGQLVLGKIVSDTDGHIEFHIFDRQTQSSETIKVKKRP